MLGYKSEESLFKSYLVIKLADFGLARLTGPDDETNPADLYARGSSAYKPPVSTYA
jgi:serine/threonine protein kinase